MFFAKIYNFFIITNEELEFLDLHHYHLKSLLQKTIFKTLFDFSNLDILFLSIFEKSNHFLE